MKMRLIISLLVLCLIFSIGSALAQTNTRGNTNAMSMNTSEGTIPFKEGVILLNGNVTGDVTLFGAGGGVSNVTGFVLIKKDLNNGNETVEIWDEKTNERTIGYGPLTPVKIKLPTASQNMFTSEAGTFAFADLKDFKCNMTNLTQENGQKINVNLTGPEMKVFGGQNDVVNRFLKSNADTSECSLTQITVFRIPL